MIDKEEALEAEPFFSDDKEHFVVWTYKEDIGYPVWLCITHDKPYYLDCVNSSPKSI
jgi:hypothetical protein